jgi:hypothetical protein
MILGLPADGIAALKTSFDINLRLFPDAFPEVQREAVAAWDSGIRMFALRGETTANEKKYLAEGMLTTDGKVPVSFRLRSSGAWLELSSELIGEERLSFHKGVYLEFMMKPYNYLGLKTQYLALLTGWYAAASMLTRLEEVLETHFGGGGSRSFTPGEVISGAEAFYDAFQHRDVNFWLIAALQDIGLYDAVYDFFLQLPEWAAEAAGESGLVITADNGQVIWTLGDETIAVETGKDEAYAVTITLPAREGAGIHMAWNRSLNAYYLYVCISCEEEGEMLSFKAEAAGLPDPSVLNGRAEGKLEISGAYVPNPIAECAAMDWAWYPGGADAGLNAVIHWLNGDGQPKTSLTADMAFSAGDPEALAFTSTQLRDGISFFFLNDESMKTLFDAVKQPLIQTLLPIYMRLPVSFLEKLIDWTVNSGLAITILDNF